MQPNHSFVRTVKKHSCIKRLYEHKHVHTGKNMFPCPSCGCDHSYTTKAALNAHMVVHEDKEFKCDTCGQTFNTKPDLKQHIQGKHAGGWRALCGAKYKWPKPMHKHEQSCKTCCKLDQKEKKHLAKIWAKILLSKKEKIGTTYLYLSALKNFRLLITIFAAIFMA